ncbi:unnamed protein product [Ilex paraguariensis]|uniref:Uncharacterized protein n=1 Tax=Ilex paraguariensis TaxID=185542 RepID=A0ABC8USF4_9AQUA
MPLSSSSTVSGVPIAVPYLPQKKGLDIRDFQIKQDVGFGGERIATYKKCRNLDFVTNSVSGDSGSSVGFDVPFPIDYSELLEQAKEATELALKDEKQLMVC